MHLSSLLNNKPYIHKTRKNERANERNKEDGKKDQDNPHQAGQLGQDGIFLRDKQEYAQHTAEACVPKI